MTNPVQLLAGALATCAVFASTARAETLEFIDDGPGFVSHFYFEQVPLATLSFPLFDTSLGMLNAVTLSITGALQARTILFCGEPGGCFVSAPDETGGVTTTTAISVQSTLPGLNAVLAPMNAVLAPSVTAMVPAAAMFTLYQSPPLLDVGVVDLDLPTDLFERVGGGTFSLSCSGAGSRGSTGSFGPSGVQFDDLVNSACGASLLYEFTPAQAVPEPNTMVLLGIGLLGLGVVARPGGRIFKQVG